MKSQTSTVRLCCEKTNALRGIPVGFSLTSRFEVVQ